MDFTFTEEQNLLRDSITKFLAAEYEFEKRRKIVKSLDAQKKNWAKFAELGLLAAPLPEAHGGLGGGPLDVLVVMEEFGKALVVEPYLQNAIIAARLFASGSDAQQANHLAAIAAGERIFGFAYAEPGGRYNLADVQTTAKKQGAGYTLDGRKAVVIGAPLADHLLVTARTAGARRDKEGVSVFAVPKSTKGVSTRDYTNVDGTSASEIGFDKVALGAEHLIGDPDRALPHIERAVDAALAGLAAEAVGAMRMIHALTLDYAKTRKQFGRAIAEFQVIQHRLVDIFIGVEQSVSMAYLAALKLDDPPAERTRAVSAAKAHIGRNARAVAQAAIQTHGGMGVTDEMRVGHYFKRVTLIDSQFGDVDHHLKRYADAA